MNHFAYRDGVLHAEEVAVPLIIAQAGTPTHIYSTATLKRHARVLIDAVPEGTLIAFSVKANGNLAILRTLAQMGIGADIVSEGELRRALAAGIPPHRIVFSGVGKRDREIALGLDHAIHQFNVESEPELRRISALAHARGQIASIALRINPDVDAQTHAKITTGRDDNKFGVPLAQARALYTLASELPGLNACAVDVHIGSQITTLAPLEQAFRRVAQLIGDLRADGHAITRADLGGGLGVPYRASEPLPPSPGDYGAMIARIFSGLDVALILEPGRLIVANAGILVSQVIYEKLTPARDFLIVDAGMNDLIRPALYDAWHDILPVEAAASGAMKTYDVVGPVCETADCFATGRPLPPLQAGALIAFMSTGAYGAVQGSTYNARPLAAEVLVNGREFAIVRPRQSHETMMAAEIQAPWLH